jgi:serine/threonine protein kinase
LSDDRYQRIKGVFYEASERLAGDRDAYLDFACEDDTELREEVENLLGAPSDAEADAFLERPAMDSDILRAVAMASLAEAVESEPPPERIGRYRIIRLIGAGGMGCVYEAVQDQPHRRVALKVLRAGMCQPRVLQRFQREVEVLGRLQHPGIARIYDAGVEEIVRGDGHALRLPFFAMEYIHGCPITRFVEERHLDPRARLELLARACDAVHFGHLQGVIHRDLKPANVLVEKADELTTDMREDTDSTVDSAPSSARDHRRLGDAGAVVKIIDFGVARATGADINITTLATDAGQILGTLAYMSPEQVRGEPGAIDARCDVHALGVLGYELLAGRPPYEVSGKVVPEAARIIRDEEPSRLSSISRVFRGDIETIFSKALEKEPARRYDSAAALAADIRRFLNDEPIVARPPTLRYQLGKFARRHKEFVAGLALVFIVLVAGIVGTSVGLVRAVERQREAERQAGLAGHVSSVLTGMLQSVDPGSQGGGRDVRVADLLDRTMAEIDANPIETAEIELELRYILSKAYYGLGVYDRALQNAQRAHEICDAWRPMDEAKSLETTALLAQCLTALARYDDVLALARPALKRAIDKWGHSHATTHEIVQALVPAVAQGKKFADAQVLLDEALATERSQPVSAARDLRIVDLLTSTAWLQDGAGNVTGGEASVNEALRIEAMYRGDAVDPMGKRRALLARVIVAQGRINEAADLLVEAAADLRRILGGSHPRTIETLEQAVTMLSGQNRFVEALPLYRELYNYWQTRADTHAEQFADVMGCLASCLAINQRYDESMRLYEDALAFRRRSAGEGDALARKLWFAACIDVGLRPHGRWNSLALQGLLRVHFRALVVPHYPADSAVDYFEWPRARYALDRWGGADEDSEADWSSISEGPLHSLHAVQVDEGVYRLTLNVPTKDDNPLVMTLPVLIAKWQMASYSFPMDRVPCQDPALWASLLSSPPQRTEAIDTLCWRTGSWTGSYGPNDAPTFYGLVLTSTTHLPPGPYRLSVTSDDGVRMWINDELVMDCWWGRPETTNTADIVISAAEQNIRLEYFQAQGTSTLVVNLTPSE